MWLYIKGRADSRFSFLLLLLLAMTVRAHPAPWPLDGCLLPEQTALLAIDMQILDIGV